MPVARVGHVPLTVGSIVGAGPTLAPPELEPPPELLELLELPAPELLEPPLPGPPPELELDPPLPPELDELDVVMPPELEELDAVAPPEELDAPEDPDEPEPPEEPESLPAAPESLETGANPPSESCPQATERHTTPSAEPPRKRLIICYLPFDAIGPEAKAPFGGTTRMMCAGDRYPGGFIFACREQSRADAVQGKNRIAA